MRPGEEGVEKKVRRAGHTAARQPEKKTKTKKKGRVKEEGK